MPITPTNKTKNVITPNSSNKGGYALWDDKVVSWDSATFKWDSPVYSINNLSKNVITPANLTKN